MRFIILIALTSQSFLALKPISLESSFATQRNRQEFLFDTIPSNSDTSTTITLKEFEEKVDECIALLRTKQLKQLSDLQHREIILCHNTNAQDLNVRNLEEFGRLLSEKHYVDEIKNIYTDWLPSRGLGYYFPKLKMQLMGAGNPKYRYKIVN